MRSIARFLSHTHTQSIIGRWLRCWQIRGLHQASLSGHWEITHGLVGLNANINTRHQIGSPGAFTVVLSRDRAVSNICKDVWNPPKTSHKVPRCRWCCERSTLRAQLTLGLFTRVIIKCPVNNRRVFSKNKWLNFFHLKKKRSQSFSCKTFLTKQQLHLSIYVEKEWYISKSRPWTNLGRQTERFLILFISFVYLSVWKEEGKRWSRPIRFVPADRH